ncbi:conserved hypothetical protein [Burkholderiales bacterium 8X]|nr:conserved hypothetical protein [Burkholderiales bacterium 8X]
MSPFDQPTTGLGTAETSPNPEGGPKPRPLLWLRAAVLLLVVLNLGYFAWSQGAFAMFGLLPARFAEREPHRVEQQVRPQALKIVAEPPAGSGPGASSPR